MSLDHSEGLDNPAAKWTVVVTMVALVLLIGISIWAAFSIRLDTFARIDEGSERIHIRGTETKFIGHATGSYSGHEVLIEGLQRGRIINFNDNSDFYQVKIERVQENEQITPDLKALMRSVGSIFEQYVKLNQKIPLEAVCVRLRYRKFRRPQLLSDSSQKTPSQKIAWKLFLQD